MVDDRFLYSHVKRASAPQMKQIKPIATQLGFDGSQAHGGTAQQAGHVIAQVGCLFDNSLLSQDFEQVVSAGQEDLRQR